jgi:endonuclease YncB( thermonuclease family)
MGLLLPTRWFEFMMRLSPSNQFSKAKAGDGSNQKLKPGESKNELLRVQIAGITTPPFSRQHYNPEQFLERLAKQHTLVSLVLLGREVAVMRDINTAEGNKRQISAMFPELQESSSNDNNKIDEVSNVLDSSEYKEHQVAICRLNYRPKQWQIFSTDIAEALIKAGNANVAQSMFQSTSGTKIVDSSSRIQDLRKDVKYLDRLALSEFDAAKKSMGMWSVPEVREMRKEVVEEVDFQAKANIFQKLWRSMRGS